MTPYRLPFKRIPCAIAFALVLGLTASVFGQVGGAGGATAGSSGGVGGETRGVTRLQGRILCVRCSLEDVRAAHPELSKEKLYMLTREQQHAALELDRVNNAEHWENITLTEQI